VELDFLVDAPGSVILQELGTHAPGGFRLAVHANEHKVIPGTEGAFAVKLVKLKLLPQEVSCVMVECSDTDKIHSIAPQQVSEFIRVVTLVHNAGKIAR
jgi:hypothetical protein